MKAIILAAGKGVRCLPLTATRPKVLLQVAGTTILEHNLRQLEGLVDEVIIVVGYMKEMIEETIGKKFGRLTIHYVEQKKVSGTGDALQQCKVHLDGRFIVLNGDDMYARADLKRCLRHKYSILVQKVEDTSRYGIVEVKGSKVLGIEEKPVHAKSSLANTGCYVLDTTIFDVRLKKSKRGEYEAVDYVQAVAEKEHMTAVQVEDYWLSVGYPWHLLGANEFLLKRLRRSVIRGKIERNVTVKGKLVLGKGSLVKSGTYIEGPVIIGENCTIGPNAYLRGCTSIGNGCKVGNATEIKNSIVFENSFVPHLSYIGDSVIGAHVNLGAGTVTANLRFDHKEIYSIINGEKMGTHRNKLGAIIGDNTQTGINVSLMPGVKLWRVRVKPNETVYEDRMN